MLTLTPLDIQIMEDGYSLSPERFVMKRMMVDGHMDIWRSVLTLVLTLEAEPPP